MLASVRPRLLAAAFCGLLLLLAALTWRRSSVFVDEETLWRDTLAKNPAATSARVNLGALLARRGAYAEALEQFQTALAAEPGSADILANLGNVLDSLNRTAEAEANYRAALRGDPRSVPAHVGLGSLLQRRGGFAEAVRHFTLAAGLSPDDAGIRSLRAGALYNLGKALDGRGDLAGAAERYREALAVDPGLAEAHNNLAVDLALAGRPEEAAAHFREALRLRPAYREASVNLETLLSGKPAK